MKRREFIKKTTIALIGGIFYSSFLILYERLNPKMPSTENKSTTTSNAYNTSMAFGHSLSESEYSLMSY